MSVCVVRPALHSVLCVCVLAEVGEFSKSVESLMAVFSSQAEKLETEKLKVAQASSH